MTISPPRDTRPANPLPYPTLLRSPRIHPALEFHQLAQFSNGSPLGLRASSASIDIARTVAWKDGIVGRLTGGVAALLKKNGVRLVKGWARIIDGKTVEIDPGKEAGQPLRITCEQIGRASCRERVCQYV